MGWRLDLWLSTVLNPIIVIQFCKDPCNVTCFSGSLWIKKLTHLSPVGEKRISSRWDFTSPDLSLHPDEAL